MSGEDQDASFRNFINLIDEDCSASFKARNHVLVVNNLFTNINRGTMNV
jgi:hypothetical protein